MTRHSSIFNAIARDTKGRDTKLEDTLAEIRFRSREKKVKTWVGFAFILRIANKRSVYDRQIDSGNIIRSGFFIIAPFIMKARLVARVSFFFFSRRIEKIRSIHQYYGGRIWNSVSRWPRVL